jgi:hypothetical protein
MDHFKLLGGCEGGSCPKVAEVDGGMLAVQGHIAQDPDLIARMAPGNGETVVLLPVAMFDQAQARRT